MPNLPTLKCTGCGVCVQSCRRNAISMSPSCQGFLYPSVNSAMCVSCGLCGKICPVNQAEKDKTVPAEKFSVREAYACAALDEKIREESSSGGMFTVLAQKILSDGGVVFGAEFDIDFSVRHGWTDNDAELERFRGSKYVQGRTDGSFAKCREFLDSGRKVLFSGTPCQIAGLKAFLRNGYENLICVDFICHGVPSPFLWQKYIGYREKKAASRTVKTAFRRKNDGWKLYSLSFTFANDSEYRLPLTKDRYMQLFLKDNCLRESCYRCSFRGDNHKSDLTLADFWGIENVLPASALQTPALRTPVSSDSLSETAPLGLGASKFLDDKGTSLVIVQSEKGQKLLDSCSGNYVRTETDFMQAVSFNPSYFESKPQSRKRSQFYKDFERHSIDYLYRRFGHESPVAQGVRLIKRYALKICGVLFGKRNVNKIKKLIKGGD